MNAWWNLPASLDATGVVERIVGAISSGGWGPTLAAFAGLLIALRCLSAITDRGRQGVGRLARFYGYRKLLAALVAAPACLLASAVLTADPASEPPPGGRSFALAVLCVAAGVWWRHVLLPLRAVGTHGRTAYDVSSRAGVVVLWACSGWAGLTGLVEWGRSGAAAGDSLPGYVLRATVVPVLCGVLVAGCPDAAAWVRSVPAVRRHLISEGHCAGWLGPWGVRKFVKRLPHRVPAESGYLTTAPLIGWTTFEDSCRPRDEVFLDDNAHLCTIAMTGAGSCSPWHRRPALTPARWSSSVRRASWPTRFAAAAPISGCTSGRAASRTTASASTPAASRGSAT